MFLLIPVVADVPILALPSTPSTVLSQAALPARRPKPEGVQVAPLKTVLNASSSDILKNPVVKSGADKISVSDINFSNPLNMLSFVCRRARSALNCYSYELSACVRLTDTVKPRFVYVVPLKTQVLDLCVGFSNYQQVTKDLNR